MNFGGKKYSFHNSDVWRSKSDEQTYKRAMVPCWGRGIDLKKAGKKIWNQSVEDIKF